VAKSVKAPLTGIFYSASSPTSPPYVTVGQHIKAGDVIGLIEAMKLFNEIKSDRPQGGPDRRRDRQAGEG